MIMNGLITGFCPDRNPCGGNSCNVRRSRLNRNGRQPHRLAPNHQSEYPPRRTPAIALHTDTRAHQICRTDIGHRAVENHHFEVGSRAEFAFQSAPQCRIAVEILAKIRSRLFGVNNRTFTPRRTKISKTARNGSHDAPTRTCKLDIGRTNPQRIFDPCYAAQHIVIMRSIAM